MIDSVLLVKFYINKKLISQYFFPGNFSVENKILSIDDLKNKMRDDLSIKSGQTLDEIKIIEHFDVIKFSERKKSKRESNKISNKNM